MLILVCFQFFDEISVEDPRISDLSDKAGVNKPYQVLQECLKRYVNLEGWIKGVLLETFVKFLYDFFHSELLTCFEFEPHPEKTGFCPCENKGADQLRSNCTADQHLCFGYTDSTIPLFLKSDRPVCVRPGRNPQAQLQISLPIVYLNYHLILP